MTASAGTCRLVAMAAPSAEDAPQDAPTRLQRTRSVVRAFARVERAEAELAAARHALDDAFGPWAAGRSISRDQARDHLASTGLLPERKDRP